jgi:hypothetical protein
MFIAFEVFSAGHVTMEKRPCLCAVRVEDRIASIAENRIRFRSVPKFIMKSLSV